MTNSNITYSLEFFPPRSEAAEGKFKDCVGRLSKLAPTHMTVTWGAGGTSHDPSLKALNWLTSHAKNIGDHAPKITSHITAIGHSRAQIRDIAKAHWQNGVRDLVVLRGDIPADGLASQPEGEGFAHASDMIPALKEIAPFTLAVGCYPETHPEAPSAQRDLEFLKLKFDLGADYAYSQFFFDADIFLRFRDQAAKIGIDGDKICPGILPIYNFDQVQKFAAQCKATIPASIAHDFESATNDEAKYQLSLNHSFKLIDKLKANGVKHFHLYTLNRADIFEELIFQSNINRTAA